MTIGDPVRLACVGLGWWGNVLAEAAADAGAEIAGGFARNEASRDEFVAARGGVGYESYEGVLEDEGVDGILLATPHTTHADLIVAAAEAGKHVFVEKPFTLTVESGKKAISAAEEAGVVLQVGHNKRRQPANRRIKEMIERGDLGVVTIVETHQCHSNALGFAPDYWRANRTESPLGGMTSLGVHMIDTMTYLMGEIETVSVFTREVIDAPAIDHATTLMFEFASGSLGYLGTSFVVPRATTVVVRGTGGTAINDVDGSRFFLQSIEDMSPRPEPIDTIDTVADQLDEFVRSIQGAARPETGGREGLEVVAVLEAAVASSETRRPAMVADFR